MSGRRLHPRTLVCQRAEAQLLESICVIVNRHNLTDAEQLRVVSSALSASIGGMAKFMIREERHGDLDKQGDTE